MFDLTRIEELVIKYGDAPPALRHLCDGGDYSRDTVLSAIRIGCEYINVHSLYRMEKPDTTFEYSYRTLCSLLEPRDIYSFAFCLSLYNSQAGDGESLRKVLDGVMNDHVSEEYAALLKDTNGWLFWDFQFTNILRLFTQDRDEPSRILKDYQKHESSRSVLCPEWKLNGLPILELMENDMLQRGSIYRLLLKPASIAFAWCKVYS